MKGSILYMWVVFLLGIMPGAYNLSILMLNKLSPGFIYYLLPTSLVYLGLAGAIIITISLELFFLFFNMIEDKY